MPFRVSDAHWLSVETDRVQEILTIPKYWRRAWAEGSLAEQLKEVGLVYSMPEVVLIIEELHRRGVVEDKAG